MNDPAIDLRAFGVAACRETLEEAALLLTDARLADDDVLALRARLGSDSGALRAFLGERGVKLDLRGLVLLSRWITPRVESRRFDARFFVARAPEGQRGAHDMTETMASFWGAPRQSSIASTEPSSSSHPRRIARSRRLRNATTSRPRSRWRAPRATTPSAPSSSPKATRSRSHSRATRPTPSTSPHPRHLPLRPPRHPLARRNTPERMNKKVGKIRKRREELFHEILLSPS